MMNVKERLLECFENNIGECVSGASIANELGVSRNAVWKAVKVLCEEGYDIQSVGKKGYMLNNSSEIMSKASIEKYLDDKEIFDIEVVQTISSTNTVLKEKAENGANQGCVLIANEQTNGKGRLGRSFYSPSQTGIYMSILLRPTIAASDSLFITTAAAVAVAKAIEKVTGVEAKIKWVNDIFCNTKKVCGILTEASINVENGKLSYAVLGIGINITPPQKGFPTEIKDIASSIINDNKNYGQIKSKIVANVLENFWQYYVDIDDRTFMKIYREKSLVIGKPIRIIERGKEINATAIDIDDEAGLVVRLADGTIKTLSSGEISIRPM